MKTDTYRELAKLVRGSSAQIISKTREYMSRMWPDGRFSLLDQEERQLWQQYELDYFAERILSEDETAEGMSPCAGVDLFGTEGKEFMSPAEAIAGQLFTAKCLVPIIQKRFYGNPEEYSDAISRFKEAIETSVTVNLRYFEKRVLDECRNLHASYDGSSSQYALDSNNSPASRDSGKTTESSHSTLTQRELDVIRLIALGKTNGEIAATLNITQNTVKNHVRHSLEKLGYENRVQLSVYAIHNKLIDSNAIIDS